MLVLYSNWYHQIRRDLAASEAEFIFPLPVVILLKGKNAKGIGAGEKE